MSSITNTITINRPIEDVFAVLTDVEQTGRWFPGNTWSPRQKRCPAAIAAPIRTTRVIHIARPTSFARPQALRPLRWAEDRAVFMRGTP